MTSAYYALTDTDATLGERFTASTYTTSTWAPTMQNAAPVSGLLVRAIERCAPRQQTRLARVTVDMLGPVPLGDDIWVSARTLRPGRNIELVEAEMRAPDDVGALRPVARATAWRFTTIDTEEIAFAAEPPLRPKEESPQREPFQGWDGTYIASLEWRMLNDTQNSEQGECWVRPLVDLVAGEEMTPAERLLSVADIANGMGSGLPMDRWRFLNTDLVVHMNRPLVGEWVGVRAESLYGSDGIGLSRATLFGEDGPVGGIQQAQLIRRTDV